MGFFISENKFLTKSVLEYFHVPTAKGVKVNAESIDEVEELQFPVVVKPLRLNGGKGVVIGIKNKTEVASYITDHPDYSEVLVEEMLEGEDARVLIVRGKYFAAVKRLPAFVIGDGQKSVKDLVTEENNRREELFQADKENETYTTGLCKILFDEQSKKYLEENGYTEETIPERGQRFFVRKNANVSMGGICVDCTDEICEEIRKQCEEAAARLTMTFAGIDIMSKDFSKPLSAQSKSGIVEINASPGIELHILVDEGQPRNPTSLMVDELEDNSTRI